MARSITVADAVVHELNNTPFTPAFTAVRKVLPKADLSDLDTLTITVVPVGIETTGATRTARQRDVQIDIGIQQKLGADFESEVEALCTLVDGIDETLQQHRLTTLPQALWVKSTNVPIYSPHHLDEHRVFTSVLSLSYRMMG